MSAQNDICTMLRFLDTPTEQWRMFFEIWYLKNLDRFWFSFFFKNCSIHWLKHVCFAKPQHKYAKSLVIATKLNHSKFRFVSVRIEACNNKYLQSSSCYYRFNYLFEFKFMLECLVILNQCLEFRYSDHNWRIYY